MSLLSTLWKPAYGKFLWKNGRMNRRAYFDWWIILFLVYFLLMAAGYFGYFYLNSAGFDKSSIIVFSVPILFLLVFEAWISFMVGVKRLHDIGYSGWYLLLFGVLHHVFINFFGRVGVILAILFGIVFMSFMFFKKGVAGDNKYGVDPLAVK